MLLDPRQSFFGEDIIEWRKHLRVNLVHRRQWRSDLSGVHLDYTFQIHEGIIERAKLPKSVSWHYMIFHEYNCFLLTPEEHIPQPPSRTLCYWLAVVRYGKRPIDQWIDSLPWKVSPDRPWAGSVGRQEIVNAILHYDIPDSWATHLLSSREIDCEA
jgi:hypothetical protein